MELPCRSVSSEFIPHCYGLNVKFLHRVVALTSPTLANLHDGPGPLYCPVPVSSFRLWFYTSSFSRPDSS